MSRLQVHCPSGWSIDPAVAARVDAAAEHLERSGVTGAPLALVLGSGLGDFVDGMDQQASVPFGEIPAFHGTTVQGHDGRVVRARFEGKDVLVLQGRLHAYEGIPMDAVVLPMLVLRALGAETVVLTNAAGGLDPTMRAGDVAILTDLLDLHLRDALRGILRPLDDVELALRSQTPGRLFDPALARRLRELAPGATHAGTYVSVWGPNYEPPLEIGMMRRVGGIAVGMSTGPEAVALRAFGTRVAGISLITNVSVEHGAAVVTHDEVVAVGAARRDAMQDLLGRAIVNLSETP